MPSSPCLGNRIPLSSCNTTLDPLPTIAWLYNPPIGVPAEDSDGICIDGGVCVVVGIKFRVASTFLIGGDAGIPPDKIGLLLLCSCLEFCGASEGIRKGSTMEEGRTAEGSALVNVNSDGLWTLFRRDLQYHIKPTTKTTSIKTPTTPPMIGPMMTVDFLLVLAIADVDVPEPPELDAGVPEIDVIDVAAGDEASAVIRLALNPDEIYDKTSKESG